MLEENNERQKDQKLDEALIHQEENLKIIIYQEFANCKPIKRNKWGLLYFVGPIEKELFGIATEDDLQNFDNKLNILLSNEKTIEEEINFHVSLLKALNNKTNMLIVE